ncbi:MAG: hypothetical protein Q8N34_03215 [Gammaproteobacteria bacterium]|nr:hypothetical protein [Gammaproteobacteria bacterium]
MTAVVDVADWRERVTDEIPDAYNDLVDRHVLDTCIAFCVYTRIWHMRMTPMSSIANLPQYKLRVPANTKLAAVIELRYNGQKLDPVIDSDLDASTPNWETRTGTPRQYTMIDQDTVRLIGIPTEALTNALTGSIAIKPARNATTVGEILWEDWAESITHGAKARLFAMKNEDWFDAAAARRHEDEYKVAADKAKGVGMNRHTTRSRRRVFAKYF